MGPYDEGTLGEMLPTLSNNGIHGTWVPAQVNTSILGPSVYTFTPDGGQCALGTTMTITINPLILPCVASTWTGLADHSWTNAGNWNPCVPEAITVVTIPAGCPNYPIIPSGKLTVTISSLFLADGAELIGQENLVVLTAPVVERKILNTDFHLFSSPIVATTFGDLFPVSSWGDIWARSFNEPTGDWDNQLAAAPMAVGVGYSISMATAPHSATFTGQFNTTNVTRTLSDMNPGTTPECVLRKGWNLLGNPFPSAIDWDVFSTGMYDGDVAVWDQAGAGNYIHWNGSVGALTNGVIPAENGFFVRTTVNGASITIPLAAQVFTNHAFYKDNVANALELRVDGNNYYDAAFVHFNNDATTGFDSKYDAYKLWGMTNAPQLYSLTSAYNLSTNELPMQGNEVVNMGFKCGVNGTYSITSAGMESFDATTPILLEDLKTGTIQDLRTSPSYTFDYNTADNEARFKLHFKAANGYNPNSLSGINIYSAVRTVVINNTTTLAGEVKIYDLAGRELMHTSMNSQNETRIAVNFAVGTYMVKVITANGVASSKVFIR
jgi:hypothetical protein